jgi:lanthanide-dependent methanol dehydrogenase
MAPLVAKGKVFVGNSGGEFGVRGWLTALDENSGKIAWRAFLFFGLGIIREWF